MPPARQAKNNSEGSGILLKVTGDPSKRATRGKQNVKPSIQRLQQVTGVQSKYAGAGRLLTNSSRKNLPTLSSDASWKVA